MNKATTLLLVFLMTMTMSSLKAQTATVDLWAEGLPNTNGIEQEGYNDETLNFKPTITVYALKDAPAPTRAVVIVPGGAYHHLSLYNEGHDWASYFNAQGMAAIVLRHRMPHQHREVPISDALEAIRQVKEHAIEWNINASDIGIMGFSAGGHLASTVATQAPTELIPAFQILFYPVITMDPALTHSDTRVNLLGEDASKELENQYSSEKRVTSSTPRCFMSLADDDKAVNPLNSIHYYEALKKAGIPASLHIFPSGGHGYGFSSNFRYHEETLDALTAWLRSF